MKRYCAAVAVLLIFSIPFIGGGAEAATYKFGPNVYGYTTHGTGSSGDPYWSEIISFDSSDEYVTVQSALEGYTLTDISYGSFNECAGMKVLVLPITLKNIGASAFEKCASLEKIYFLGDKPSIGAGAIPSGVEIYCLSGTSGWDPSVPVLALETYAGIGYSFSYYVIDGKATVHSWISGTDIVIPSHLGGYPVEEVGNESFRGKQITSVVFDDAITKIGVRAFYGCSRLVTAVLPSSLVMVGDEAFRSCSRLNNVDLQNAEYIGFESFRMCRSFTEVIIPDSVTVMMGGAFRVCSSVVSLTIGSGITEIPDWAFDRYSSLENLEIRGKVTSVGNNAFLNIVSDAPKLERISLPYAETIGSGAFSGCIELKEVIFGDGLKEIGAEAFRNCRSLQTISLPASVEKVGDRAFMGAVRLADIYFEGPMPQFGANVFVNTGNNLTVHVTEAQSGSWAEFEGNVKAVSDARDDGPSGGGFWTPATMAAVAAAVIGCVAAAGYFMFVRRP